MEINSQIGHFDFADIIDDDGGNTPNTPRSARVSRGSNDVDNDTGFNESMIDGTPEWLLDDEESDEYEDEGDFDEEVEDEEAFGSTLEEITSKFDDIDDTVEFHIGGEAFTKADIVDSVRTRAELKEAHSGISTYVSNLSEVEMRIQTYLSASMTETETRLRQVESMLERPESMTPTEVQKALVAKRDLTARQNQLEQNAKHVRAAEEERRQQIDLMKIRQTDAALKTSVAGYKGIATLQEVASWAQKEGISQEDLRSSMSPALIKALLDAKTYREKIGGKKQIREAAAKRVAPKSVSTKPKARSSAVGQMNKQKAYERAAKAGDTTAMFNLLED